MSMNFISDDKLIDEEKNVISNEMNDIMTSDLNKISFLCITFILLFGYLFHKISIKHKYWEISILITIIIPIIAIIYNMYYNTYIYKSTNNLKRELKEIKEEIKSESKYYEIIAFILFGIGLIYAEFKEYKYLSMTLPYLMFSLLFGSIITSYLKQLVFNYNDIRRLFQIDVLTFCSSTIATGLLSASIIIPIVYHSNKSL